MSISERAEAKKRLIQQADNNFRQGYLIFHPPTNPELIYTDDELIYLAKKVEGEQIPAQLGPVVKSHWVKKKILEHLGYVEPSGFRTKEAKKHKPKFINQYLDIFAQKSRNLQVWNYVPYAKIDVHDIDGNPVEPERTYEECRYIIVYHDKAGNILKVFLKSGAEIGEWDRTGTKTIKWQANISILDRQRHSGNIIIGSEEPALDKVGYYDSDPMPKDDKLSSIIELDNRHGGLVMSTPEPSLLYTFDELRDILVSIIGLKFEDPGRERTRNVGQDWEKAVAETLGYVDIYQTDTGGHPDLRHQLIETKFQFSGTVDLGMILPTEPELIPGAWNQWGLTNADIRYVIALLTFDGGFFEVDSVLVISGCEFNDFASICEGTNEKVQIPIPARELL